MNYYGFLCSHLNHATSRILRRRHVSLLPHSLPSILDSSFGPLPGRRDQAFLSYCPLPTLQNGNGNRGKASILLLQPCTSIEFLSSLENIPRQRKKKEEIWGLEKGRGEEGVVTADLASVPTPPSSICGTVCLVDILRVGKRWPASQNPAGRCGWRGRSSYLRRGQSSLNACKLSVPVCRTRDFSLGYSQSGTECSIAVAVHNSITHS